jgi:hypothetical protein
MKLSKVDGKDPEMGSGGRKDQTYPQFFLVVLVQQQLFLQQHVWQQQLFQQQFLLPLELSFQQQFWPVLLLKPFVSFFQLFQVLISQLRLFRRLLFRRLLGLPEFMS